ncbi:PREDICTED: 15-hydroxyprostaglandin dehydrogenase [NAD(+)]-like [Papilio polytes]|uniref:15-hydroxyprostaglandin dehydrogenase [NAD(+)]-like n=1 Tax=Papilio polytes TaxID=76194 RepID=UPI00067675F1|nr:PREDICTED: 15-hydroxyprostaglandin dehydrogenase [NAD(+)]-like [Papilio polytes]
MDNLISPEGKTFLVTGGASGIGKHCVETFLREGAKAVAILDVQVDVGQEVVKQLNETYPNKVIFIKCDVGDEKEVTEAFEKVIGHFKQLDVVMNNAGIMVDSPTGWRKACDVNWQGLVSSTLKGLKHMRQDEGGVGGTIINVSSIAALYKFRFLAIYNGSKMAVLHFSQSLACPPFFEKTGVRILTVCFGATETALLQGLTERTLDDLGAEEIVAISTQMKHQKVESAAAGVLKMFKEGANGSIWLSTDDKPAKDITPVVDSAFKEFEKAFI